MKKNMGTADRVVRIVIASSLGTLYLLGMINGAAVPFLLIVFAHLALTSITRFCPEYLPLGFNTIGGRKPK